MLLPIQKFLVVARKTLNSYRHAMRIFLWAALLLAAVLRACALLDQTLWLDEGYSVLFSRVPVRSIVLSAGLDTNPPLGNAFFHFWCQMVGYAPVLMRLPGVAASLLSLALLWRLLQRMVPLPSAVFVVLFKSVSLYDVLYSRQLRVYPYAELLLVFSWICLQRYASGRSFRYAALWAACSAAAIHLHYFCALVVFATSLLALIGLKEQRRSIVAAIAILCLLVAPLGLPLAQQVIVHRSFVGWIPEPGAGVLLVVAYQFCGYSLLVLGAALVLLFAAFVIRNPRTGVAAATEHREFALLCVSQLAVVVGLAALLSLAGGSFFHPRYFFFLQVPFLGLLSLGLCPFGRRVAYVLVGIVITAAGIPAVVHVAEAAHNPTGAQVVAQAVPALSERTILVHQTKCSFSVGQAYDRFRHQHRLIEGAEDANVFHFPGLPPVFISGEEAAATPDAVLVRITEGCN